MSPNSLDSFPPIEIVQIPDTRSGKLPVQMQHSDGTALPLVRDASGPSPFGADLIRFAPGEGVPLHTHPGSHILKVEAGVGILTYGEKEYPLVERTVYLIPPNVPHAISTGVHELVLFVVGNDHRSAGSQERLDLVKMPEKNRGGELMRQHEGFNVVRGDLVEGGLKSIILRQLLLSGEIPHKELVYCADPYGHSQIALAKAAHESGKRVTFFTTSNDMTPQQHAAITLGNTKFHVIKDLQHQSQLPKIAKKYAEKNDAYYLPIGFDFEPFNKLLVNFAQSLPVNPTEVWVPAGSGTTFRALRKAWPHAKIYAVNLGMMPQLDLSGADHIYTVPEAHKEQAQNPPPYSSNPWYDAKIWQFVKKYGSKNALIWNIA